MNIDPLIATILLGHGSTSPVWIGLSLGVAVVFTLLLFWLFTRSYEPDLLPESEIGQE